MSALISAATSAFWGLLMFSVLVFLHEGGHFLAARACGVRVTEFFLGLPFRWNIHHASKRIGTKFGITPLLIGGYAMICGMEPVDDSEAPKVLSLVHRRGRASVEEIAEELGMDEDTAMGCCVQLMGWGSLAPVYNPEKGETPSGKYCPTTYASMPRDAKGMTIYDGRLFDRAHATAEGESWEPVMGEREFFESERSRTYLGKGFWKRAFMLVAGVVVNLVSGFLLLMSIYSIVGIDVSMNYNTVGAVEAGSVAQEIGISAGDTIESIDGIETQTWSDMLSALDAARGGGEFELVYSHGGVERSATVALDGDEMLGISATVERFHLNPIDSAELSLSYIQMTAQSVAQLVNPSRTLQVLDNSTSIVGISVMSAEAASAGATAYLTFAALISFSLGCMNLLPIPPLDGGKLLIEIIQALIRRPLPIKVQTALSYGGLLIFCFIFIYVLRGDILRLIS